MYSGLSLSLSLSLSLFLTRIVFCFVRYFVFLFFNKPSMPAQCAGGVVVIKTFFVVVGKTKAAGATVIPGYNRNNLIEIEPVGEASTNKSWVRPHSIDSMRAW